jgi:MFS transporter, FSR family, fosmidomycin resistance protein
MSTIAAVPVARRDAAIISVVAMAHFSSHLMQLALPSLFFILHDWFSVTYTELGLVATVFYVASGFGQSGAGVLVDRYGAQRVLVTGLLLLALGVGAMGMATHFWMLAPLALVAGLGNSVFHPADLSILSHRVSEHRLGRAFAVHGIAGSLGFAASPVLFFALTQVMSWRIALLGVSAAVLGVTALVYACGDFLAYELRPRRRAAGPRLGGYLALVRSPVVLLAFGYFALTSFAGSGIQTQGATALKDAFDLGALAPIAVTSYLVGSAFGIVGGGFLAEQTEQHHRVAMAGIAVSALLLLSVAGLGALPGVIAPVMALAGVANGLTAPSRDMIIRRAAARGETGSIFGFVYSGFDLGSSTAPPLLGALIDHQVPSALFIVAGLGLLLAVPTVMQVQQRSRRSEAVVHPAE